MDDISSMQAQYENDKLVAKEASNAAMFVNEEEAAFYYSGDMTAPGAAADIYNMSNAPDMKLSQMLGKVVVIKDIYMDFVNVVDKATGELKNMKRCVLMDMDGTTYSSVSTGIVSSVAALIRIHGWPTWEDGVKVEVIQREVPAGRMYTLKEVK